MVTVVLADDHVVVRQGLRALLESDPRVVIVGEAADGLEAVELVRRRKPTVLITDLMMPGLDGLATTRKLSHLKSDTRVIILSMYGDQAYVLEALKSGAAGYVVKESCGAELFEAIRVVVAGRRYLSPAVSETSIGSYSSMGTILQKAQTGLREVHDKLTVRERKVLARQRAREDHRAHHEVVEDQSPRCRIPSSQLYAEVGPEHHPRPHPLCTAARDHTYGRATVYQEKRYQSRIIEMNRKRAEC